MQHPTDGFLLLNCLLPKFQDGQSCVKFLQGSFPKTALYQSCSCVLGKCLACYVEESTGFVNAVSACCYHFWLITCYSHDSMRIYGSKFCLILSKFLLSQILVYVASVLYRDCRLILSVVDAKRSSWHLMLRATSFNCFLLV